MGQSDDHFSNFKWQRVPAALLDKSGGVCLGDTECCTGKGKIKGSSRFGAQGAMIIGKKLPLAQTGTTVAVIGTVFVNHDIGNRYFPFREAPQFRSESFTPFSVNVYFSLNTKIQLEKM